MLAILTTHPIQYQVPLWKALAKEGTIPFEVWYLSDHGTKPTYDIQFGKTFAWDIDTLSGYPYRFLKVNPKADVSRFEGLRLEESLSALFREKNVQALWIQGWQVLAYWQAVWVAHRQGIPVWLRAETNDLHTSHWYKRLPRNLALTQLFKWVSQFLYIGSANRRLYKQFNVPDSRLIHTPYFIDNERFMRAAQELAPNRSFLRQQWNIPADATCFLFCGKFITKKHPLDLLEAVILLVKTDKFLGSQQKLHILMVGDGELYNSLENKARELETLCGHSLVTFVGFLNQTDIPKAYVAADCLVLPSDAGETWGLVVNEALACGCPVLVSDQCGCAEDLALPLDNRSVFSCGNIPQLAARLQTIVDGSLSISKQKCLALSENYSVDKVVTQVTKAYCELISL